MRTAIATFTFLFAVSLCLSAADARPRKRGKGKKAKKELVASEETKTAVKGLMGKYKWGMSTDEVLALLEAQVREHYVPNIQKERDPLKQDRLRREMMEKVKETRKNYIKFEGQHTPWDVSMVDKEFAHKNNESMALLWGEKDRRFYFFHHEKLWKIYIAFASNRFKGRTFEDFAAVMEKRFGEAERKYTPSILGDPKLDHLAWPVVDNIQMRAIDNTGLYGNFCLVLIDAMEAENVERGRELNAPKRKSSNSLVQSVTSGKGSADLSDANEDIIDQITGQDTTEPVLGGKPKAATGPVKTHVDPGEAVAPSAPKKKKRKISSDDPLGGIDL